MAGTEDFVVANDAFRAPAGLFLPFADATALMPIFPLADFAAWTAADVYGRPTRPPGGSRRNGEL